LESHKTYYGIYLDIAIGTRTLTIAPIELKRLLYL
jgi:hypothetical protein